MIVWPRSIEWPYLVFFACFRDTFCVLSFWAPTLSPTSFSIYFSNSCFAFVRFIGHQCVDFGFLRPRFVFVVPLPNLSITHFSIFQVPTRYPAYPATPKISPLFQQQKTTDTKSGEWDIFSLNDHKKSSPQEFCSQPLFYKKKSHRHPEWFPLTPKMVDRIFSV